MLSFVGETYLRTYSETQSFSPTSPTYLMAATVLEATRRPNPWTLSNERGPMPFIGNGPEPHTCLPSPNGARIVTPDQETQNHKLTFVKLFCIDGETYKEW